MPAPASPPNQSGQYGGYVPKPLDADQQQLNALWQAFPNSSAEIGSLQVYIQQYFRWMDNGKSSKTPYAASAIGAIRDYLTIRNDKLKLAHSNHTLQSHANDFMSYTLQPPIREFYHKTEELHLYYADAADAKHEMDLLAAKGINPKKDPNDPNQPGEYYAALLKANDGISKIRDELKWINEVLLGGNATNLIPGPPTPKQAVEAPVVAEKPAPGVITSKNYPNKPWLDQVLRQQALIEFWKYTKEPGNESTGKVVKHYISALVQKKLPPMETLNTLHMQAKMALGQFFSWHNEYPYPTEWRDAVLEKEVVERANAVSTEIAVIKTMANPKEVAKKRTTLNSINDRFFDGSQADAIMAFGGVRPVAPPYSIRPIDSNTGGTNFLQGLDLTDMPIGTTPQHGLPGSAQPSQQKPAIDNGKAQPESQTTHPQRPTRPTPAPRIRPLVK